MDQSKPTTGQFSLYVGLILSAVTIVFTVILLSMDLLYPRSVSQSLIMAGFNIVIALVVLIVGIFNFRKANNNVLAMSDSIKIAVGAMVVATIIGVVFQYILMNYIEPDFIDNYVQAVEQMMLDMGPQVSDDVIATQVENTRNSMELNGKNIAIGFATRLLGGLIAGSLIGLILKKKAVE